MTERSVITGFSLSERDFVELGVDALKRILASKPLFPFVKRATFEVPDAHDPERTRLYYLIISAQAPEPIEEIIAAAANHNVRVLPCGVMTRRHGPRIIPVMFAADRPIGRIAPGPIELSLWLDIGEVPHVQQIHQVIEVTVDRGGENHPDNNRSTYHG